MQLRVGSPAVSRAKLTLYDRFHTHQADLKGWPQHPAKDAAMTPRQFQTFYPNWEYFARFRDPMITSSFWERVTAEHITDTTGARPTV